MLLQHQLRRAILLPQTFRALNSKTARRKEYFVAVWDKVDSNRSKITQCDLKHPVFTFAGEILAAPPNITSNTRANDSVADQVVGNAFSCFAEDVEEVKEKMIATVYYTKNIWDISTAQISPLETVHTSPLLSRGS